ncbi:MAG: hypothetical protein RI826_08805 [Chlorobium phaeovibrioides]|uniref:hypothetical protein n=1 Tax=Chlorobium phaeovibrioides TaxID=1094 RepID=UPI001CE428D2|nr:hypothetical protein [Chlorobium phaeovibrioides]MDT9547418.1 hypothetical protein [Chlorobium phaeovibrioides]
MPKPRPRAEEPIKPTLDEFILRPEVSVQAPLNPNAPRKFKTISLPLNEYEAQLLSAVCTKTGRSEKNFFRYALMKYAKQVTDEYPI